MATTMTERRVRTDTRLVLRVTARTTGADTHDVNRLLQGYQSAADMCNAVGGDEWEGKFEAYERQLRVYAATGRLPAE